MPRALSAGRRGRRARRRRVPRLRAWPAASACACRSWATPTGSLGVVTLDRDANDPLEETRLQSLIVLQSILALGLEQATARERLLEAHEELEGLYAAKTKMIDHLSHELKTPLAVLSASTGLLGRPAVRRDDERAASVLERMDRSIGRLLELQEEARDIAEADASTSAAVEIALERWVPEVLAEIAPLHRHRAVRVETALCARARSWWPSRSCARRSIGLVRNAIEATADGGWVRVSLGRARRQRRARGRGLRRRHGRRDAPPDLPRVRACRKDR